MLGDAIHAPTMANNRRFGLATGGFTDNVDATIKFAREPKTGNIHINRGPQWRANLMPCGGLRNSGFGKEECCYAVEEMIELRAVIFHLND